MPRYRFSDEERHAVYTVHGEKCYLCRKPIDMMTFEVDHLIPESLKDRPDDLRHALHQLGLGEDFDLNSYANWLPACRPCNEEKSDHVFELTLLVQIRLQRAAEKAGKAEEIASKVVSRQQVGNTSGQNE